MANLTNPVTDVARFAMKNSSRKIGLAGEQIATGKRGPSDIVDYVIGSKLRTNAEVLSSVSKNVNYGINMLKNAQSVLESAKSGLLELKKIIAQANTAQGDTSNQLNALYLSGVANVLRIVGSANYDGRNLLDGSLVARGVLHPDSGIPANGAPLDVRVGEAMNNTIRASLPRLLCGTANHADNIQVGTFQPLFPAAAAAAGGGALLSAQAAVVAIAAVGVAADPAATRAAIAALIPAENTAVVQAALAAADSYIATYNPPADGAGATATRGAAIAAALAMFAAGDVSDAAHQAAADGVITNALNTVTGLISSVGGQLANFQQAGDDVNSSIKVQNEAADSYLNTNYEEASRDFKNALLAMRGSISITTQGYRVAEAALNLIEG